MNTFNRILLVILVLLAMVVCSLAMVVPIATLQTIARQAELLADLIGRVRSVVRLPAGIFLALILDLIGILLIILEVRRAPSKTIRVHQASGGDVTLSLASIADQVKKELNQFSEIVQAKPKVSARRKGVFVELDARIAADAGVPNKAERIIAAIRRVVEEKMGLQLARPPRVNIETVGSASAGGRAADGQAVSMTSAPVDLSGSQDAGAEQADFS